jgi:hypothetical protein
VNIVRVDWVEGFGHHFFARVDGLLANEAISWGFGFWYVKRTQVIILFIFRVAEKEVIRFDILERTTQTTGVVACSRILDGWAEYFR